MNIGSLNTVVFDEAYHVGGKKGLENHQDRLKLKQSAPTFKSPDVALKGRKNNFYRSLLKGIQSHIDRMSIESKYNDNPKRDQKRISVLNKRLESRQAPLYDKEDGMEGVYQSTASGVVELNKTAYGQLLQKISKETNIPIKGGVGGKQNCLNVGDFRKELQDTKVDLDSLLSDETKKELLTFEKDLRMTKSPHKLGSISLNQAESIASTVNGTPEQQQQAKQVATLTENIKKQAEKAPKSWIGQKIRALRDLYSDWLEKKNREYDQGKLGFFNGILRIIANCIDWLLEKLQKFAG